MDEDTRNPVEVLAEEFVDRYRRGESPSIEEYALRHPEHAEDIDSVFQAALLVERLKRGTGWPSSPAADARDPMPPIERLGDYRIVREIGRGGMGVVYEAEQEALRRPVALKVLVPWAMGSSGRVERFRREAQAAANLHHTNIVQVFGVGEQEGLHFYVMQLIDGRGLDESSAEEDARFGPRRAAEITRQIAAGLAHAHERGVLHRDVKPANVLLDTKGTAWITDFGLAKILLDPAALTEAGDVIGTIRYMPPERFEGRSDARGDVYGLGLVLYELLAGRAAFADKERGSLIRAVREGKPEPLGNLAPGLPADLTTIVERAIAPNVDDRYQTAADLADDLERFLDDRPIRARRVGMLERARRWRRRNKALAALSFVAVAAVLLAAATGWIGYLLTQGALERESEGRARAEAATKRAEANEHMSLEALEGIFDSLASQDEGPAMGGPPVAGPNLPHGPSERSDAELLQSVLAFYDRFAAENETNPRLRREAARALQRVGVLHARAGDAEAAGQAFGAAVARFEAARHEFPGEVENTQDLARTLSEAAMWATHAGSLDDGLRDAERAVALGGDLVLADPGDERSRAMLARARCRLAFVLAARGDEAGARAALGEAASGFAEGLSLQPEVRMDAALAYQTLAGRAAKTGDDVQALADLDAALGALRPGMGHPAPPEAVARVQRERAVVLRRLGRVAEAERAATEGRAVRGDGPLRRGAPPQGGPPQGAPPRRPR